jgi:hypothetical protein
MLRNKITKQALQQGFTSRSRWLLQILGLRLHKQIYLKFLNSSICNRAVKNKTEHPHHSEVTFRTSNHNIKWHLLKEKIGLDPYHNS